MIVIKKEEERFKCDNCDRTNYAEELVDLFKIKIDDKYITLCKDCIYELKEALKLIK